MIESYNTLKNDCQKITFYNFINDNKTFFNKPVNDGFRTMYKSKGGTIILSIDDTHPTQTGTRTYRQKITPKNTVKIYLNIVVSSFLGIKKTDEIIFKIEDEIEGFFKINKSDSLLFQELKQLKNMFENNLLNRKNQFEKEKKEIKEITKLKLLKQNEKKKEISIKLKNQKHNFFSKFDKDDNGKVDIIEGDFFKKILSKHQNKISEIDIKYVHKFIKISKYIDNKKDNIQLIFDNVSKVETISELKNIEGLFKNQVHYYNTIIFHSLNMINSLINNDFVTFFEIYDKFDELNIFESNWEKNIFSNLTNIEKNTITIIKKIEGLMIEINSLEMNLIDSINDLQYYTNEGFNQLNQTLESELRSINSSIDLNILLNGIQTYQLYKINKQTKGLIS